MKTDKVIIVIAKGIVWLERLRGEINTRRFEEASKLVKKGTMCPKIYVTKVVNEEGQVIATLQDLVVERN